MQIRVVSDRPWSVPADVLAVPIISEDLVGSDASILAELDRRLGGAIGEYRRLGEVDSSLFRRVMLRAQDMGAPWVLAVGAGALARFDRLTAAESPRPSSAGWQASMCQDWPSGCRRRSPLATA